MRSEIHDVSPLALCHLLVPRLSPTHQARTQNYVAATLNRACSSSGSDFLLGLNSSCYASFLSEIGLFRRHLSCICFRSRWSTTIYPTGWKCNHSGTRQSFRRVLAGCLPTPGSRSLGHRPESTRIAPLSIGWFSVHPTPGPTYLVAGCRRTPQDWSQSTRHHLQSYSVTFSTPYPSAFSWVPCPQGSRRCSSKAKTGRSQFERDCCTRAFGRSPQYPHLELWLLQQAQHELNLLLLAFEEVADPADICCCLNSAAVLTKVWLSSAAFQRFDLSQLLILELQLFDAISSFCSRLSYCSASQIIPSRTPSSFATGYCTLAHFIFQRLLTSLWITPHASDTEARVRSCRSFWCFPQ